MYAGSHNKKDYSTESYVTKMFELPNCVKYLYGSENTVELWQYECALYPIPGPLNKVNWPENPLLAAPISMLSFSLCKIACF